MITQENPLYCDAWIFIVKNLRTELHKNWNICNNLLTIVEKAFKSLNMEIRRLAYLCWQNLIENFALSLTEIMQAKRIKLLLIPLRTNNCKTDDLIKIKLKTWCTLFNVLNNEVTRSLVIDVGVFENYLNFCFGNFSDTPFVSYTVQNNFLAPGRKCQAVHLHMCFVFLKTIAGDETMKRAPKIESTSEFNKPFVTNENFTKRIDKKRLYRIVIFAVGESSIVLSQYNVEEENHLADILNMLLWEALFDLIESARESNEMAAIIEDLSETVLDLIELARKKRRLSSRTIIPLFQILNSNKYHFMSLPYFHEKIIAQLFSRIFKKDNDVTKELLTVYESILMIKTGKPDFGVFVNGLLNEMSEMIHVSNFEKINNLLRLWIVIGKKLINIKMLPKNFENGKNDFFLNFLQWGAENIHRSSLNVS